MGFYNRNKLTELSSAPFAFGVYQAVISDLKDETSPKGFNQFKITLKGSNGEQGLVTFTFGTKFTEEGMMRLLASIEDSNQSIPQNLDFDYDVETAEFLLGKSVLIWVRENLYLDSEGKERKGKKIEFVTLAEFESLGGKIQKCSYPTASKEEFPYPEPPASSREW